jgi:hypothetical protein
MSRPSLAKTLALTLALALASGGLAWGAQAIKLDYGTVASVEMNKSFPNSKALAAALKLSGYAWKEDDYFGPDLPEYWTVKIGADIDVKTAKGILDICVSTGKTPIQIQVMSEDSDFGNRRRVYIGGFDLHNENFLTDDEVASLLAGTLSQAAYAGMGH